MIAVAIANRFDNRAAFFASALIYLAACIVFKYFKVAHTAPSIKPVNPRRTIRALWRNTLAFFRRQGMARAYAINFGYYSLRAMRYLYVPIVVIENGFGGVIFHEACGHALEATSVAKNESVFANKLGQKIAADSGWKRCCPE